MGMDFIGQAPAVQTLNSAIHRINHYPAHDPADKYLGTNCTIHWIEIYPPDSAYPPFEQLGPDLKTDVENDIFWSAVASGFLEPGGTPTTIIPRNTPPPPRAQATSCLHNSNDDNYQLEVTQLQQ